MNEYSSYFNMDFDGTGGRVGDFDLNLDNEMINLLLTFMDKNTDLTVGSGSETKVEPIVEKKIPEFNFVK